MGASVLSAGLPKEKPLGLGASAGLPKEKPPVLGASAFSAGLPNEKPVAAAGFAAPNNPPVAGACVGVVVAPWLPGFP